MIIIIATITVIIRVMIIVMSYIKMNLYRHVNYNNNK